MYTEGRGLLSNSDFLYELSRLINNDFLVKTNKNRFYYNIPAGFDIEVTSFYDGEICPENKRGIMYVWQFGVYNIVTYGRTWDEFIKFLSVLRKVLLLDNDRRLIVYVHNLPYEFQFIRKRLNWDKVFLLDERKPVYCVSDGIEFRCSLKLAGGKSLANVGKDLQKYKAKKAVGNLDYSLIRTPLTPLTDTEFLYCENDIRVILAYIQEKIETDGDITKIPLTNTGYVRNFCRINCFSKWKKYHNLMTQLTVEPDEYSQLKRAFQGGFTHANAHYVGKIIPNVSSQDLGSSYPSVMVLNKFPMGKGEVVEKELDNEELMKLFCSMCCLFDIELFDVVPKLFHEHPISKYKCWICENATIDNGRIVTAQHIAMTITEQDYFIYSRFYNWESIVISNLRVYQKQYLPTQFVKAILYLYGNKTSLKGKEGEEINYMISKNMINSAYGMSVTDPIRDELLYEDGEFISNPGKVKEGITRYNENIRRFLFYPWGVWVTAYARANLFSGIIELGDDYIYSDTDSLKYINPDRHANYFIDYNDEIRRRIDESSYYHRIDSSEYMPKTQKGIEKPIGLWEYEGIYEQFKTLGAKRYLTFKHLHKSFEDSGIEAQLTIPTYSITLAGANKDKTKTYLRKTYEPFNFFDDKLTIPPEFSGRLTLTYIDNETEGDIVDLNGELYHYHELSSVHMEPSEYNLSMADEFRKYLSGFKDAGE